jgi:hypothetical protein
MLFHAVLDLMAFCADIEKKYLFNFFVPWNFVKYSILKHK